MFSQKRWWRGSHFTDLQFFRYPPWPLLYDILTLNYWPDASDQWANHRRLCHCDSRASPLFASRSSDRVRITTVVRHTRMPIHCPCAARHDRHQWRGRLVRSVDKLRKAGTALIVMLLVYAIVACGTTYSSFTVPTIIPKSADLPIVQGTKVYHQLEYCERNLPSTLAVSKKRKGVPP